MNCVFGKKSVEQTMVFEIKLIFPEKSKFFEEIYLLVLAIFINVKTKREVFQIF